MSDKKYLVSESQLRVIYLCGKESPPDPKFFSAEFQGVIHDLEPIPQPTKSLSEMKEEDAKKLCEAMGWEFSSFKIPDKRTTIVMRIKWNGKNHFFILTKTGSLSFHEVDTGKNYPINPFTLVSCLKEMGYGIKE